MTTHETIVGTQTSLPLPALAAARIEERLRAALALLREPQTHAGALRDALSEALDRADALEVSLACGGARSASEGEAPESGNGANNCAPDAAARTPTSSRHAACLRSAALRAGGEPVREFLLIPLGDVEVERPLRGGRFTFTREHAEAALAWFERIGRKLVIDYEHQSFDALNGRADGLRPAAGWIGGLALRDDGLWATDVTWTPRAEQLLRAGEYRYFSPVLFWSDAEQTQFAGLGPVALTNDPAMHGVQALAARRAEDDTAALVAALARAREELDALQQRVAADRADHFVAAGLRSGRITPATRGDWRDDYLRDPAGAEARLQRAPVVLPPGRLIDMGREGAARVGPRSAWGTTRHAGVVEAADIEAYERAVASGCVRNSGPAR